MVRWLPSPRTRCRPSALAPGFWLTTHQIARNHNVSGVRVSWRIVPAVTDTCCPHVAHILSPRRVAQAFVVPHAGHEKSRGHRSGAKYSPHAASLANRLSSSMSVRG